MNRIKVSFKVVGLNNITLMFRLFVDILVQIATRFISEVKRNTNRKKGQNYA